LATNQAQPDPQDGLIAAPRSAAPESDASGGSEAHTPALSIVALDDDADFRQYIATVLESQGHEVRVTATPGEFFAACESRLPDLVLLDMKMGEHSGEDVLAGIRQRWSKMCVIVVTGYPSLDSMRQTFKRDVFDYLAKPFSVEELTRTIRQAAASLGLGQRPQDRLRAELGRQIRLARTERGWTLKELSEACGISVSQLSSIERGTHLPSLESLVQIAGALERPPSAWMATAGL
jgi:FixJ family two-component response regulator